MESRTIRYGVTALTALLLALSGSACTTKPPTPAQDPGVRGGDAGAGESLPGLPNPLRKLFAAGRDVFAEAEGIADGLGPRMNLDSCFGCHANPAIGGSSPESNPQFLFHKDKLDHKTNTLPSFITEKGPTREARFIKFDYDTKGDDGGVHEIFLLSAGLAATLQKGVIEPEEAYLEQKFDDKYLRYKAKVRRWI